MKEINRKTFKRETFQILLSKEDVQLLSKVLFREASFIKKDIKEGIYTHYLEQVYKMVKELLTQYTTPKKKERSMYRHHIENLDLLLTFMDKYLYEVNCSDSYINLYERLCRIYKKRYKELRIAYERTHI